MSDNIRHIFFDEPNHKYTDQFGNDYTSVTTCVEKFVIPFKTNYWAKRKAIEQKTSPEVLKQQWKIINKDSTDKGTKKHNTLESAIRATSKFHKAVKIVRINNVTRCYSIPDLVNSGDIGEMSLKGFYDKIGHKYPLIYKTIEFYVNRGYKIFSEINVYDPYNLISGTIDVLLVKGNDFVIIDWKTNRNEITFESGYYKKDKPTNEHTNVWIPAKKYMFFPIDNLEDCVGNHYKLQLSLYANMVEQFGYNCKAILLFHIRDPYLLNKWGMPRKDKVGRYIIDDTKSEYVEHHIVRYAKEEAERVRNFIGASATMQTQQKLIM